MKKMGMLSGDRLPLDFIVIGESTPVYGCAWRVGGALLWFYLLRRLGFNRMSLAATGEHPSLCKTFSMVKAERFVGYDCSAFFFYRN